MGNRSRRPQPPQQRTIQPDPDLYPEHEYKMFVVPHDEPKKIEEVHKFINDKMIEGWSMQMAPREAIMEDKLIVVVTVFRMQKRAFALPEPATGPVGL
jgi:hypothetical protein